MNFNSLPKQDSATSKLNQHFACIGVNDQTPENVLRAGVLKRFPRGTTRDEVVEALRSSGACQDKKITITVGDSGINCRIQPGAPASVFSPPIILVGYDVTFSFDTNDELSELSVRRNLTGM